MISVIANESTDFQITNNMFDLLENISKRPFTRWLDLPNSQENLVNSINDFVQERKDTWDKIIVLGMGGSALGITTLKQAFFPFDDRLIVIDNLDSNAIHYQLSILDPKRTIVLVISKSGGTLETMTNYQIFKEKFGEEYYKKNFITITDPLNGRLREITEKDGLISFPIPSQVGGRFSVLTAVGLLPLALLGGDISLLLSGAKEMKHLCFQHSEKNPAFQLAISAYELSKTGKNITVFISYSDQLYFLSLWYQQLLAESIGKTDKIGLTPLPLRGASDQHSVLQLLQEGPRDKFVIFMKLLKPKKDIHVYETNKTEHAKASKHTLHEILNIELDGTEQALRKDCRPTMILQISEISEKNLGALFFLLEMQIAILGELYEINAYNQPGVEKSKKIVKESL